MEFKQFRKETELSCSELEEITGYTRQGMSLLFKRTEEGKPLSKKSLICINAAIEKRIQEEAKIYEEKMDKLRKLQEMFKED